MQAQLKTMDSRSLPPKLREPDPEELSLLTECLAPLRSVCRPPLDSAQLIGYFNALSDLPAEAVLFAASEICGRREYTTWPMPGEIRSVAVRAMVPNVTAGEAWRLAQAAASTLIDERLDFKNGQSVKEWNSRIWDALPRAVAETLRIFGGRRITDSTTAYAQFRDEYERQVTILRRPMMLPAQAKAVLLEIANREDATKLLTDQGEQILRKPTIAEAAWVEVHRAGAPPRKKAGK